MNARRVTKQHMPDVQRVIADKQCHAHSHTCILHITQGRWKEVEPEIGTARHFGLHDNSHGSKWKLKAARLFPLCDSILALTLTAGAVGCAGKSSSILTRSPLPANGSANSSSSLTSATPHPRDYSATTGTCTTILMSSPHQACCCLARAVSPHPLLHPAAAIR